MYDQAFFDTEKTTEKGIQVVLFTMSGGKKEYEIPLWTILPDLDHSKVELKYAVYGQEKRGNYQFSGNSFFFLSVGLYFEAVRYRIEQYPLKSLYTT